MRCNPFKIATAERKGRKGLGSRRQSRFMTSGTPRTRPLRAAMAIATGVGALGSAPLSVWAESSPAEGMTSNGTIRFAEVESGSYPSQDDDPETFYGLFSLEGACGFDRARIALDYTESFFIALHQKGTRAGGYNALGKIEDEAFSLEVLDANGAVVRTYTGSADEHATAVGSVDQDGQTLQHSNYSFMGTATSDDGSSLRLIVKGRYRTDPRTGELRRFDYGIQSCRVT
ncbi:MAG TPA: hypothetical protein VGR26_14425 [Acidimicrobiales bacterium]|nr:hypothetical protein [Acidimicrobiales bacterium]